MNPHLNACQSKDQQFLLDKVTLRQIIVLPLYYISKWFVRSVDDECVEIVKNNLHPSTHATLNSEWRACVRARGFSHASHCGAKSEIDLSCAESSISPIIDTLKIHLNNIGEHELTLRRQRHRAL